MKKSKKLKKRIKNLKQEREIQELEIQESIIKLAELWAEIRKIKGDAFDMINNARVQ